MTFAAHAGHDQVIAHGVGDVLGSPGSVDQALLTVHVPDRL
jgi:hypothetical protein